MPPREMRIPDGAQNATDEQAVELARIWWVVDHPEFVLSPRLKDPKNIGRVLYEAAFHFSNVYSSNDLGSQAEVLEQIKEGWASIQDMPMATRMSKEVEPKEG